MLVAELFNAPLSVIIYSVINLGLECMRIMITTRGAKLPKGTTDFLLQIRFE